MCTLQTCLQTVNILQRSSKKLTVCRQKGRITGLSTRTHTACDIPAKRANAHAKNTFHHLVYTRLVVLRNAKIGTVIISLYRRLCSQRPRAKSLLSSVAPNQPQCSLSLSLTSSFAMLCGTGHVRYLLFLQKVRGYVSELKLVTHELVNEWASLCPRPSLCEKFHCSFQCLLKILRWHFTNASTRHWKQGEGEWCLDTKESTPNVPNRGFDSCLLSGCVTFQ